MRNKEDILKDTPEYEDYDKNEVKLTIEEMRELGLLKCSGGCCKTKGGCNKEKSCCKSNGALKFIK